MCFFSFDGSLIDDVRCNVRFFDQLHYSHVKRESNKVAHNLASVSDRDWDLSIFLKLGLTRMNGLDRDVQNVEFTVKCTPS